MLKRFKELESGTKAGHNLQDWYLVETARSRLS